MKDMLKKSFFIITFIGCVYAVSVSAQSPCSGVAMPAGTLCITVAAGNVAVGLKKELDATKEKIVVLESALKDKDVIIADNKLVAQKNEDDLKDVLHKTEIDLATKTGTLIGAETMIVRLTAAFEFAVQNTKKKKIGFINIF